jgi:hypothetical protein
VDRTILSFPTLLDLWLLALAAVVLFIVSWRLTDFWDKRRDRTDYLAGEPVSPSTHAHCKRCNARGIPARRLPATLFPLLQLAWCVIIELCAHVFDQSVSDLVRTSLSLRLISLRLNRHQLQGCGVIFLKEFVSRPWRIGPAKLGQIGCSGMHAYFTPYAF